MDLKESDLIKDLHKRIIDKQFNETDMYAFLILLRSYAVEKTPVREFGDFIVHREKDRGFINEYLIRTKDILDNLGKENAALVINIVFSIDEIKTSFNETLKKLNLQAFDDDVIRIIIVFIMSLLQDVSIIDKNRISVGKLLFSISKDEIILLGRVWIQNKVFAIFPVLSVENWFDKSVSSSSPIISVKIIKVLLHNKIIRIETT